MQILSPYGKDVIAELKSIYGFDSIDAAAEFIKSHIQRHYQLQYVFIKTLHIAYGLVAKLKVGDEIYHLKFASTFR